jgi:hypothetical protein
LLLARGALERLADVLPKEDAAKTPTKGFKDYTPGFVHMDVKYLPQMADEDQRTYLFVAIDRATRWVYLERLPDKSAASARGFLQRLLAAAPFKITTLLTDNGKELTDRLEATGEHKPTRRHPVDRLCAEHVIEHRLIRLDHRFGQNYGTQSVRPCSHAGAWEREPHAWPG